MTAEQRAYCWVGWSIRGGHPATEAEADMIRSLKHEFLLCAREAVEAEREACIRDACLFCRQGDEPVGGPKIWSHQDRGCDASRIRARGNGAENTA